MRVAWNALKFVRDLLAVVIFLLTLTALFIPAVRKQVSHLIASNYGLTGHVYYEVDSNGNLTAQDGRLLLLKTGGRQFSDIGPGDRMMAADGVNLRDQEHSDTVLLVLQAGDCVVVLDKIEEKQGPFADPAVASGGTLLVATGPCELDDRPRPL